MTEPTGVTNRQAAAWADLAVRNLGQEFPHATQHVVTRAEESARPAELHPSFHGSFDWHSAVHMHWLLVSLLHTHPNAIDQQSVLDRLGRNLTAERLAIEADYLDRHPTFERPYGWAWLLALHAAAERCPHRAAQDWAATLRTTTDVVAGLVSEWLESILPVRHGVHQNSAFACVLIKEAAPAIGRPELTEAVDRAARRWFASDHAAAVAWEPSGHDFLSPVITEADLMRRVLGRDFGTWWDQFIPDIDQLTRLRPATVSNPQDGHQTHLYGLSLSRAWQLTQLGQALAEHDPAGCRLLGSLAEDNLSAGLAATDAEGEFMSDHWLASFAYLALQRPF